MQGGANSEGCTVRSRLREYWQETRRPVASLLFVLPLLLLYEGGVIVLGASAVRNGADIWLRTLLDWLGLGGYYLLPALTVAVLLAWHHVTHDRWRVRPMVLYGMLAESAALGFALLVLAQLQGSLLAALGQGAAAAPAAVTSRAALSSLARLVGFFGAGIYEEVLFRLLLLPAAGALLGLLFTRAGTKTALAVLATSLIFSAAHYVGPHGETLQAFSFVFRVIAGAFFAILFVYRGFGVAAGAHALYDIFAGLR